MDNNSLLTEIIKNNLVETIFQPVADIRAGLVIGYEALSRGPEGTDFYMPIPLISQARSYNRAAELDVMLCESTLNHAQNRGLSGLLFMNLDTNALYTSQRPVEEISKCLDKYHLSAGNIVIEFSEQSVICSFSSFIDILQDYRNRGFKLCFDNVGSAYSNLFTLSKIRPDFMKISRQMTQGISLSSEKKSRIDMELMIADLMKTKLIAQGVETLEDLRVLLEVGVEAAQGMIIGEPEKEPGGIRPEAMEVIRSTVRSKA